MNKQYQALASVYDALMYDIGYDEWSDYIIRLLGDSGVESGARLLEYACGTGNITLPLARRGYRVTAVDISEEMLLRAQEKTRKGALQIKYACSDMSIFELNKPMRAAVCACDGVNYILDNDSLGSFFKKAYHNLEQGGVLLFDISSAYKLQYVLGNEFYFDDGDRETYFWQNAYDEKEGLLTMDITLFVEEEGVYKRFDERHVQRAWRIEELTSGLQDAGFTDVRAYAFLSMDPPTKESDRIQFAATRR